MMVDLTPLVRGEPVGLFGEGVKMIPFKFCVKMSHQEASRGGYLTLQQEW